MNASAAVLIGSAFSAIVAMGVVGFQYSLERRRQLLVDRAERLANFLASTFAVSAGIEQIAIASSKMKDQMESSVRSTVEDQLNRCLTRLRLFEDSDVVAAATYLERELTRIIGIAKSQVWSREHWRAQRSLLSKLTNDYEGIARHKLGQQQLNDGLGFYMTRAGDASQA